MLPVVFVGCQQVGETGTVLSSASITIALHAASHATTNEQNGGDDHHDRRAAEFAGEGPSVTHFIGAAEGDLSRLPINGGRSPPAPQRPA